MMTVPLSGLPGGPPLPPRFESVGEPLEEGERGLVLRSPLEVQQFNDIGDPRTKYTNTTKMRPERLEINQALLLWDRIHIPEQMFDAYGQSDDIQALAQEGLVRTFTNEYVNTPALYNPQLDYHKDQVQFTQFFAEMRLKLYELLEDAEPGQWAMSDGLRSPFLPEEAFSSRRGLFVEIHNMMPIPDASVALDDVLEFRMKRKDELLSLRKQINKLYLQLSQDPLDEMARNNIIEGIEHDLKDYKKVFSEIKRPGVWASLGATVGFNLASGVIGAVNGLTMGHSLLSTLQGASSGISLTISKSLKASKTTNPYEYVAKYHHELKWFAD